MAMATAATTTRNVDDARCEQDGVGVSHVGTAARVGLMALRFYKAYLSVLFAGQCRFVPSCSQFSYEAVERFGLARGSWLTLKRLLRCHPFSGKFGFDPVPDCCGDRIDDGIGEQPHQRAAVVGAGGNFEGHS
jgi:putative membrane protein insertion efficiency factor